MQRFRTFLATLQSSAFPFDCDLLRQAKTQLQAEQLKESLEKLADDLKSFLPLDLVLLERANLDHQFEVALLS
jgi:hypothetical protein